jgi:hypothetical protein
MLPAAVAASGVRPTGVFTGRGWNTLEVVIAQAPGRPSVASIRGGRDHADPPSVRLFSQARSSVHAPSHAREPVGCWRGLGNPCREGGADGTRTGGARVRALSSSVRASRGKVPRQAARHRSIRRPGRRPSGDVLLLLVDLDAGCLPGRPVPETSAQRDSAETLVTLLTQPVASDTGIIGTQNMVSQPFRRRPLAGGDLVAFSRAPARSRGRALRGRGVTRAPPRGWGDARSDRYRTRRRPRDPPLERIVSSLTRATPERRRLARLWRIRVV